MAETRSSQPKRRGSDRRREKSRVAARCRRNKEAEIFSSLVNSLPREYSTPFNNGQLDKASIMRLTLGTIKFNKIIRDTTLESISPYDSLCLEASDGFIIVLSTDGEIVYISRNVVTHLGMPHVDFIGHSLFQFTHPCETPKLQRLFEDGRNLPVDLCFRIKSACSAKRGGVGASFEVVYCRGSVLEEGKAIRSALLLCQVLPEAGAMYDVLTSSALNKTFVTRHRMNMKMIDCDEHVEQLIGYRSEDLLDRSLFEMCHAADIENLGRAFKQLFGLGKVRTEPYRLLSGHGGHVWLVTTACVCYEKVTGEAYGVKCFHEMVTGVEDKNDVIALTQDFRTEEKPVFKTESVFCPLTDITEAEVRCRDFDMNSESLVNLAPHAGETCVSLEFPSIPELIEDGEDMYTEVRETSELMPPSVPTSELLSIRTDLDESMGRMSPGYPPSEGFSANVSPAASPLPYPSPRPAWPYNQFSPLPDDLTLDPYPQSSIEKVQDWDLPFTVPDSMMDTVPYDDSPFQWFDESIYQRPMCKCSQMFAKTRPPPVVHPPASVVAPTPPQPKLPTRNNSYSALMTLLLAGDGRNYKEAATVADKERRALPIVTTQDAEVNVPVQQAGLLTGQQLLEALELDCPPYG